MFGWLTGIVSGAKAWLIGGLVALAGIAFWWLRRDAAKDERGRITAETQSRRIEDMEKAREVEHRAAGLSDDEIRNKLRALAARGDRDRGV